MIHCFRELLLILAMTQVCAFAASNATTFNVPQGGRTGFTIMSPQESGVTFTNLLSDQGAAQNQIRYNGSGVALGDVDHDGLCDIFLCGLESPNVLYKNLGGLRFTNITGAAGLKRLPGDCTGAVFVDVDGDEDLDLLVNAIGGGSRIFVNDGSGKFTDLQNNGLAQKFGATSAAFGDIDGDGLLDLYVANYRAATIRSAGFALLRRGTETFVRPEDRDHLEIGLDGRILEKGEPDFLYHNRGNGNFTPFSWTKGLFRDENNNPLTQPPRDWGLAVTFRDLNGDRAPDIYVCNDFFSPDRIWMHIGGGFRELPRDAMKTTSTFSMTVDVADINRDGFDDIFVGDMLRRDHLGHALAQSAGPMLARPAGSNPERPQILHNTLQLNRGDGTYAEIAQFAGLDASDWTWSAIFCDVDLDGYEDLLCATGQMFDTQDLDADAKITALGPWPRDKISQKVLLYPRLPMKNLAFRNGGNLKFDDVSAEWGFNFLSVANAMALADLDNDGDLDVVVNNLNGVAQIYRNDSTAPRLAVRLKGMAPNTRGIGARIIVRGGAVPMQSQEMICGGRYLSSDDTVRTFAAGTLTNDLTIEVIWRRGGRTIVKHAKANTLQIVDEADAQPYSLPAKQRSAPVFSELTNAFPQTQHRPPLDDFALQPMLPHRLSNQGSGIAWANANSDGRNDLLMAEGASVRTFISATNGIFSRAQSDFPNTNGEPTTILSWPVSTNESFVVMARANFQSRNSNAVGVYRLRNNTAELAQTLSLGTSIPGSMCAADVDLDGGLDLFVGGRMIPGSYPMPAQSTLFTNHNGHFTAAQNFTGLVSAAVFSDIDADGSPELIVACDWGPIRVYKRVSSRFEEQSLGLEKFLGLWNGVTTGDFDGDGLLDIVATNWGENTKYERFKNRLRLYYGNWSGDENVEMLESFFDSGLNQQLPLRGLDLLKRGAPELAAKFATYAAYSRASVDNIVPPNTPALEVNHLATTVFLNRTNHFEAIPLPPEAQFAPAFGVSVADFDGDGVEDVFLAQNYTDPANDLFWNDAGQGLLLRGNGDGTFKPLSADESGIKIAGDARGCAVSDYDGDGRIDLAVAVNGGPNRVFRNTSAKPGLRLVCKGPASGAMIRTIQNGKPGPAHEIKIGSGYWSQDSGTLVLPRSQKVQIRWANGKVDAVDVSEDAKEVTVDYARLNP